MKYIFYGAMFLTLTFAGCGKDDNSLTPEQINTMELTKSWSLGTGGHVLVDGQDISGEYAGFSITFESNEKSKIFYVTNGNLAFPQPVDTWSFTDDTFTSILRGSDGVVMKGIIEGSTLMLTFSTPAPSGGRVDGTFGEFEFFLDTE